MIECRSCLKSVEDGFEWSKMFGKFKIRRKVIRKHDFLTEFQLLSETLFRVAQEQVTYKPESG
jgi:hypothetical protein